MANRTATFKTTKGEFSIELFEDKAPKTTENFIKLVTDGYYNDLIFHRIIEGFMIQGGCPNGTGTGSPGYTIDDEFDASLSHDGVGVLSMANSGPNSGGSQFFITLAATNWLDGKHAIFGKVSDGLDVIEGIGKVKTSSADRPSEDVVMHEVVISV